MKQLVIITIILMFLSGVALAQDLLRTNTIQPRSRVNVNRHNANQNGQHQGFGNSWNNNNAYMQPYKHNAYGPGVHSDATGRPFEWKTQTGQTSHSNKVKPNGYGLGVGMDEYGRPVKPSPWGQ